MVPNEPAHVGRAAIEEWATANWGAVTFSEGSQTLLEVDGRGDIAYARLSYSFAVEVAGMDEPIMDVGKGMVILRKQGDGSWLVSHSIYNADSPPPGAPEGT
jgi:ketosteroid isomerase-like protein